MEYKERIRHVAIYLRKSRNNEGEETEKTLQKHRKRLVDITEKNKWKYEMFQEVGSSMNENRPEYSRMVNKLSEGIFDAVLSVNLARVTRDDEEAPRFMKLIRQEDILFITDSERVYDLEVQEDFQALKFTGFVNNWEYENIKAQLRKGKKDSAKMGRWSNGIPNYGYVYNKLTKELEIDKEKEKGVKLSFQMVIDGVGVDNVAIELNKLGYRTNRSKYFHGHSIKRMIEAPIYKGWIVSNRIKGRNEYTGKIRPEEQWIVVKDAVKPCIIDEDTWFQANEAIKERKMLSPRRKQRRHGLSGIVKCSQCGKSHAISNRKDRNHMKVLQSCKKKDSLGNTCRNKGFNYNAMMDLIIDEIAEFKTQLEEHLNNFEEVASAIDTKTIKVEQVEARLKVIKNSLKILQLQLEEELITIPEFKERKQERNHELIELEKEYNELMDKTEEDNFNNLNDYATRINEFLNEWETLEDEKLNQGLSKFIEKILWHYPKEAETPNMDIIWKKVL